jgi:SNF2 family DNA or RNA helicase
VIPGPYIVQQYADRFKLQPYKHQLADIAAAIEHEFYGFFLEMRLGKTKIMIDSACILREEGRIDSVLVISPAKVRSVWVDPDPEMGEIRKHAWLPSRVYEFHSPTRMTWQDENPKMEWVVTNYDFIRNIEHREKLKTMLHGRRVMMVLDESSFIKTRTAAQTKACIDLGKLAARRYILNGTPVTQSPLDLWTQMQFLSSKILPYRNYYQFRYDFAVLGGWHNKQVIRYQNLDKLQDLAAPHVVRREQKDCLDLPPTLETQVEVPLTEETWKIYKAMKDEAVVWLEENPSLAAQAGVRIMRLCQITSGFLGGFVTEPRVVDNDLPPIGPFITESTQEVGREKLDWLREFVKDRLAEDPTRKIIAWCRFRPELERVAKDLGDLLPTYRLYGGARKEAEEAKARFSKLGNNTPALLAAQPQAGGFGLNLIAADINVYMSHDHSLMRYLQSKERSHGPGQLKNVLYVNVLATGPKGQKTIDHAIVKALRNHQELAQWTCSAWRRVLTEE